MVSITERMASMQSTYDQNAGPIDVDMTNDSDSNFQDTALQIKLIRVSYLRPSKR